MEMAKDMTNKIIIVGAGLAGLSAALTATKENRQVILVSQGPSERAQSVMAEGGINGALNTKGEEDSPQEHCTDTLKAGCNLANPKAVWNMTKQAPQLIRDLHKMGVQFNIDENKAIDLRYFGGQKKRRTAFAQSDTGKQIMTALIDALRQRETEGLVQRMSHHDFVTLLTEGNACRGCVVQDTYTGELLNLEGDAVIMATGGMNGLFGDTTGSIMNTGEATAELFRLGVSMANLEMIQYHPTTAEIGGKRMLISEAARGEGGRLFAYRDGMPWYFMEEKYPELGNLMPRDITAREIAEVRRETEVYLDLTKLPQDVMEHKLSGLVEDCKTYLNKDLRREPIPVAPGIHYFMGGIDVDELHQTSMENLFAAGECAAQYHGANRLGGNSLLGAIYGGKVAAEGACRVSPREGNRETKDIPRREVPEQKKELQAIMQQAMGILRSEEGLQEGLAKVQQRKGNLALLGQAVIQSALARKESRGAHWRTDYPQLDDENFCMRSVARYDGSGISITFEPTGERQVES